MPQPYDELSLRHLPDVSDSSFSFQIPGAARGDNLLADDDLDFFKGADVSIAPLASPPTTEVGSEKEPPFTLSELTPKPEVKKPPSSKGRKKPGSFPTLSYDYSGDHDTNPKREKANPHQLSKVTTNVNILSKSKPKVITTSSTAKQLPSLEGSPVAERLDNIRTELNLFGDNLFAGPSTSVNHQLPMAVHHRPKGILSKSLEKKRPQQKQPQRILPRHNQKVIEGGIFKTRCVTKLSSITSCHPCTIPIQQEQETPLPDMEPANGDLSFADSSISSAAGGVAGRLVMYGQKLINSFGYVHPIDASRQSAVRRTFNSDSLLEISDHEAFISQDQAAGTDVIVVQSQGPQESDRPLTLSQLSPQKLAPSRDSTPTPRDDDPMSLLRLPCKRPISVASNDVLQKRKKSKNDASSADALVSKPLKARLSATKRHPKRISSNSKSDLKLNGRSAKIKPTSTRVNEPGTKQPPVFKSEGPELNSKDARITTSVSNSSYATSRLKNSNQKNTEPVNSIMLNDKGKSVASSNEGSSKLAPQSATKPVPFHFQTDRRGLNALKDTDRDRDKGAGDDRRSESQSEKRLHPSKTVPDFKAMHAAQEAELALRKENIQPVVPLPIQWETDHRLKERQKFDERIREKEREQERLMELKKREREEQEEREVRELRKKAIPKAHEVPEWYKEAPKKKKKDDAIAGSICR